MKNNRVFLGGTIGEKSWRNPLIDFLKKQNIPYFDPVLPETQDWNEKARENEEKQKQDCGIHFYLITPEMRGVYSIAEITQSSNTEDVITIACFVKKFNGLEFEETIYKNFHSVAELLIKNKDTYVFFELSDAIYKILEFK